MSYDEEGRSAPTQGGAFAPPLLQTRRSGVEGGAGAIDHLDAASPAADAPQEPELHPSNAACASLLSYWSDLRASDHQEPAAADAVSSAPTATSSGQAHELAPTSELGAEGGQESWDFERPWAAFLKQGERATEHSAMRAALGRRGAGMPLPTDIRKEMERTLGRNFARVRIHTDEPAARAVKACHAEAFTAGEDVFLDSEQTLDNRQLLRHELTHVAQQYRGGVAAQPGHGMSMPSDSAETEAYAMERESTTQSVGSPAEGAETERAPEPLPASPELVQRRIKTQPAPKETEAERDQRQAKSEEEATRTIAAIVLSESDKTPLQEQEVANVYVNIYRKEGRKGFKHSSAYQKATYKGWLEKINRGTDPAAQRVYERVKQLMHGAGRVEGWTAQGNIYDLNLRSNSWFRPIRLYLSKHPGERFLPFAKVLPASGYWKYREEYNTVVANREAIVNELGGDAAIAKLSADEIPPYFVAGFEPTNENEHAAGSDFAILRRAINRHSKIVDEQHQFLIARLPDGHAGRKTHRWSWNPQGLKEFMDATSEGNRTNRERLQEEEEASRPPKLRPGAKARPMGRI